MTAVHHALNNSGAQRSLLLEVLAEIRAEKVRMPQRDGIIEPEQSGNGGHNVRHVLPARLLLL